MEAVPATPEAAAGHIAVCGPRSSRAQTSSTCHGSLCHVSRRPEASILLPPSASGKCPAPLSRRTRFCVVCAGLTGAGLGNSGQHTAPLHRSARGSRGCIICSNAVLAGPSGFTPSVASKRPALASPSKAPSKRQKVAPATQTHSIKGKEPMLAPEEHTDQEMPPAEVLLRLGAVSREAAAVLPTAMDEMFTRHSVVNLTDIK